MKSFFNALRRLTSEVPKGSGVAAVAMGTLGTLAYASYYSVVTIQPGHLGIIYNRFGGLRENYVMKDGLNFVIPWFQRAIVYDVRTRPQLVNTQSGSKGMGYLFLLFHLKF